ncbi:MAG TPA: hypothetical protein VK747_18160 [Blastocatellia bacterium]|nr:hypothetical protein [Blastocatellia bacterium]
MINILSIRCALAFVPYLLESAAEFLNAGAAAARVVRQTGSGLIIRSEDEFALRYQSRESSLGKEDVRHYLATIQFIADAYDVKRTSDEVVISTVGRDIVLSHPQSELWLDREVVAEIVQNFNGKPGAASEEAGSRLAPWLSISTGGGRLLFSDGRTGRWVLLGSEHLAELERRLVAPERLGGKAAKHVPPTITLKGATIHLQSALKLAETLEHFESAGEVKPFEEITPAYSLAVSRCTEGMEIRDSNQRVALTAREARKWSSVIRAELGRLNLRQVERGKVRTVFADIEEGRWILQWGDQVFVPNLALASVLSLQDTGGSCSADGLFVKRTREFLLLLNCETGSCVALTESESIELDGTAELIGLEEETGR